MDQNVIGIDAVHRGKAAGSVAEKLLKHGMSTAPLRPWIERNARGQDIGFFINQNGLAVPVANATLRKEEWKHYDSAIIQVAMQRLVGVADLNSRGLVYNIGNGLGTTVMEYEDVSDVQGAQINMDGVTRGEADRPDYSIKYLPLPIIHGDFQVNIRALQASRTRGSNLDTTIAEMKARKIAEKLEDMLFNGISGNYPFAGGNLYGYLTAPNRNTASFSVGHWNDSPTTALDIVADVLAMKQALIADRMFGPYMVYVPTAYETVLDEDYHSGTSGWNGGKTTRQRIRDIEGIQDVKVSDFLTADKVVMVQMTSDVVRMVNGLPLQTVEWDAMGGMVTYYKIMTIQVPQIRADQEGHCGICVLA